MSKFLIQLGTYNWTIISIESILISSAAISRLILERILFFAKAVLWVSSIKIISFLFIFYFTSLAIVIIRLIVKKKYTLKMISLSIISWCCIHLIPSINVIVFHFVSIVFRLEWSLFFIIRLSCIRRVLFNGGRIKCRLSLCLSLNIIERR